MLSGSCDRLPITSCFSFLFCLCCACLVCSLLFRLLSTTILKYTEYGVCIYIYGNLSRIIFYLLQDGCTWFEVRGLPGPQRCARPNDHKHTISFTVVLRPNKNTMHELFVCRILIGCFCGLSGLQRFSKPSHRCRHPCLHLRMHLRHRLPRPSNYPEGVDTNVYRHAVEGPARVPIWN